METTYKKFSIIISSEHDDNSGLWNGRYRILDNEGVVAYESFVEPQSDEEEAFENGKRAAKDWIDEQTI